MKMLIIEDDPFIARIIEQYAQEITSERKIVAKLGDAMREIQEWQPDAVWLDLILPDSNNHKDTLAAIPGIKMLLPHAIIIVMSGIPSDAVQKEAIRAGADAFMEKGNALNKLRIFQLLGFGALNAAERVKSLPYSTELLSSIAGALRQLT